MTLEEVKKISAFFEKPCHEAFQYRGSVNGGKWTYFFSFNDFEAVSYFCESQNLNSLENVKVQIFNEYSFKWCETYPFIM